MNQKKLKRSIYISCFGVLISVIVLMLQLFMRTSIVSALGVISLNLIFLLINFLRYRAYKQDN